mmetsp:Transcript_92307/g.183277  ORF Transcript_92307/g.183277 Transcript_92307/m.183277 type:complete len:96 (-) Transcript_92307:116-403(-)
MGAIETDSVVEAGPGRRLDTVLMLDPGPDTTVLVEVELQRSCRSSWRLHREQQLRARSHANEARVAPAAKNREALVKAPAAASSVTSGIREFMAS